MKRIIIIAALATGLLSSIQTNAQRLYNTSIGLRVGGTNGFAVKQFIGEKSALEGIVGFWTNSISATLMYQRHNPSESVENLNWYYGAGAHISSTFSRHYYLGPSERRYYVFRYETTGIGVGIDAQLGIEYKVPSTPIAFSFDLKPFGEIYSDGLLYWSVDPGVGIKLAF